MAGMKDGDYIVSINEQDVKWSPHDQVVNLIKKSGNSLKMKLVTPMDKSSTKEKVCKHKRNKTYEFLRTKYNNKFLMPQVDVRTKVVFEEILFIIRTIFFFSSVTDKCQQPSFLYDKTKRFSVTHINYVKYKRPFIGGRYAVNINGLSG